MPRRLGAGFLLASALGATAWAQGASPFDGQYVGQLTLMDVVSGDCTRRRSGPPTR